MWKQNEPLFGQSQIKFSEWKEFFDKSQESFLTGQPENFKVV